MIILLITFLFYKKSDNRQNFVTWFVASISLLLCYNTFLTQLLSVLHIPINMLTYPLINILLSIFFLYQIFYKKEYQLYMYNKLEIFGLVIIVVSCILVSIWYFGWPLQIKYQTTDPNVHYFASNIFSRSDSLLYNVNENLSLYEGQKNMMNLFYCNAGLLMKSFSSFYGEVENFIIFIIYNIFSFTLTTSILYASVLKFCRSKIFLIITVIISLFYGFGYPLNEMMFGFGYLGNTVIVISLLFILMREFPNWINSSTKSIKIMNMFILFLSVFSVFYGYYLFVPFVYGALFIYFCIYFYQEKRLFTKSFWLTGLLVLGMPTLCGFISYFLPSFISLFSSSSTGTGGKLAQVGILGMEGYIYRDLYSNFLFFVPTLLYFLFYNISKKINDFEWLFTILLVLYILLMFILGMKGIASSYYYFKNYFVMAFVLYYIFIMVLSSLYNKNYKVIINCCLSTILLMFVLFQIDFDTKVARVNELFNVSNKLITHFDIYALNEVYKSSDPILNNKEIELVQKMNEIIKDKKYEGEEVLVNGGTMQRLWFFAFTKELPNKLKNNTFGPFYEDSVSVDEYMNSDVKYLVSLSIDDLEKCLSSEDFEVVFSNSEGFILSRN